MADNGYESNGWPPPTGVYPGGAEPDDSDKLAALIAALLPQELDYFQGAWLDQPDPEREFTEQIDPGGELGMAHSHGLRPAV